MLRINQQSNAVAAKSYYTSATESGYYGAANQEQVGAWGGKAAERLSLDGEIVKDHFDRLCDNRDPHSGERLTARMRADRRVGYDFTFSCPKSVSILYAITDDPEIITAFRWAMNVVMQKMEAGVKARVRKRGQFGERTVGNMAWGEFIHFTARPVKGEIDPQVHGHCFVPNVCWDHVEKVWKAIDVASIKEGAPIWQEMFQNLLADRLGDAGYGIVRNGNSFEIAGITRDMIERFSRRTHQINQAAEKRGITDPRAKDTLGAMTRERKRKDVTMPQLRAQWRQHLTDGERDALGLVALKQRHAMPGGDRRQNIPPADDATDERFRNDIRQRQRIAAHERARASYTTSRPAPMPPPPPQNRSKGYGR